MKLKILAVVLLGAVGVGAAFVATGGLPASASNTTRYLTSAAATGDVNQDVAATGALAAVARYGLAFGSDPYLASSTATAPTSQTTWPVKEVKVVAGDTVTKGEVLASADTADLKTSLVSAQRSVSSAQVSLRAAKTTLSDAVDADVTAQIRQAKIGLYGAEGQLEQAIASRDAITAKIKRATLVAPAAGIVSAVNITAGFDAPAGVAIIIDSTGFQVTTDVVESDLADVKVGQTAAVTVAALGADLTGTVTAISPVASSSSGSSVVSYPVTVTLKDPPATLRSGMTADVTITIANATGVLTVPAAALRGTTGNYSVLLLGADGTPVAQTVQVGLVTNTLAEIKGGLTAGQAVVTGTSSALTNAAATGGGFGGGGVVAIPGGGFGGGRNNGGNGGNRVTQP
jgi:membrane fusion protein, macrolide-specific efflux system